MHTSTCRLLVVLAITALGGNSLSAKEKHPKPAFAKPPQDEISVESHITVAGGPVTRFIATRHYDRSYVYAERDAGAPVTLIDVTKPRQPQVLGDYRAASPGALLVVAGTAALTAESSTPQPLRSQTIRIMDFSDPTNVKVTRQFEGVTALENIGGGIVLLANADGIWILSQRFAEDPEIQKRYAYQVLYGPSMY